MGMFRSRVADVMKPMNQSDLAESSTVVKIYVGDCGEKLRQRKRQWKVFNNSFYRLTGAVNAIDETNTLTYVLSPKDNVQPDSSRYCQPKSNC
jgi:hypothetical protein